MRETNWDSLHEIQVKDVGILQMTSWFTFDVDSLLFQWFLHHHNTGLINYAEI
jgi:hypothetical protein